MPKRSKRIIKLGITIVVALIIFRHDLVIPPYHYVRSLLTTPEKLIINIPDAEYKTLDSLRKDVLFTGKARKSHKHYVKTSILYKDKKVNAKIRLKGDQMDHYEADPPSYRVKTLDNQMVLGTEKFSIQSFAIRNFINEWIYLKLLSSQNILAINTDVIELQINEKNTIYTFEEHFTHHLTDRFKRPRGPILCISEKLFWNNGILNDSIQYKNEEEIYLNSPIKTFKYYAPLDSNNIIKAKTLLNNFRNGTKTASEVFDVKLLATHYAISDLTNTHHALRWHNHRYYFDPITGKLELIGFDGSSWEPVAVFYGNKKGYNKLLRDRLFSNKGFVEEYVRQLERISSDNFINDFLEMNSEERFKVENKIYRHDLFFKNDYSWLYSNAKWIRNHLDEYKTQLL